MIPKLKYAVVALVLIPLSLCGVPLAFAGGLEEGAGEDLSNQIQALRDQINGLNSTVEELKDENASTRARSKELESELATIKGLQPGSEIATSMENRVASLEDKVGTIKVSGSLTAIVQSSVNRRNNPFTVPRPAGRDANASINQQTNDQTIGAGSFDLYLESRVLENTRLYANLEANSPNQVFAPTLSVPNGNGTFRTHEANQLDLLNVLELYVESQWYDKKLTTTIGKIDLTNYFDGNKVAWDEHRQFLAGAFLDNATFTSALPFNTIGARASWDIGWGLTTQIAVVSDDNSGLKLFNQLFAIWELDYQTFALWNREGNYRVYGYVKDVNTVQNRVVNTGASIEALGIGFSFDQKLTDKLTAFSRFGWNDSELSQEFGTPVSLGTNVERTASVGAQYEGLLPNRPQDIVGAAWAYIDPVSPELIDSSINGGVSAPAAVFANNRPEDEQIIEFYYRYEVAKNLHISPVLQFLKGANGDDDENWAAIFGGRAFLEF